MGDVRRKADICYARVLVRLNGCFVADQREKNQELVLSFQALSGKFRDQTTAI